MSDEVELEVRDGRLIVAPARPPRAGWDDRFAEMAERGDDRLLDVDVQTTSWDESDWEW